MMAIYIPVGASSWFQCDSNSKCQDLIGIGIILPAMDIPHMEKRKWRQMAQYSQSMKTHQEGWYCIQEGSSSLLYNIYTPWYWIYVTIGVNEWIAERCSECYLQFEMMGVLSVLLVPSPSVSGEHIYWSLLSSHHYTNLSQ